VFLLAQGRGRKTRQSARRLPTPEDERDQLAKKGIQVQSLVRAVSLLEVFARDKVELSLKEISEATGLSKSTCYRLLSTLEEVNFVERDKSHTHYRLGMKLFELGLIVQRRMDLRRQALPFLVDLAEKTGETAFLMIRDEEEVLCIERVEGTYPVRALALNVGGRLPLHLGGGQRALLAELPDDEVLRIVREKGMPQFTPQSVIDLQELLLELRQTRERGYGRSWEDITPGVAAIGALVRDYTGNGIAAVSIAGIVQRFGPDRWDSLIELVKAAARNTSLQMGYNDNLVERVPVTAEQESLVVSGAEGDQK
jgi:IclR family transcriptional regulator, KDG regulon repressor